jgi:MFS family permease
VALNHPLYRRFWLGSLASVGGVQLMLIGQGWLVFELSGSPLDLGILGAASSIPTIFVSLFGGVLADRLDKRKVIAATSLFIAVLMLLLAILDYSGVVTVWQVFVIAALVALAGGLDWPARQAIFPSLIEREQMMSAIALNSILWQSTRMVLPALGGVLIVATDTSFVFLITAIGFLVMVAVLITLPGAEVVVTHGSSFFRFIEGVRFIAARQLFAVLIPLTWIMMFFGTSVQQLMPAFADLLGSDGKGYGALISATGVGSMIGTLIIGQFPQPRRLGWIMLGALALMALILFSFSLLTGMLLQTPGAFYIAMGMVLLIALFSSIFLISSMTVLQLNVPDELRGRVMSIHGITFSLIALGGLFGGAVASWLGLAAAVAVGAAVIWLAVAWVAATRAGIRDLDGSRNGW